MPFRGSAAVAAGRVGRGALTGSRFRRLYTDVYVSSQATVDHRLRCAAAALILPAGAALAGRSALSVHCRWMTMPDTAPVEVVIPPSAALRPNRFLVVRRSRLPPADVCRIGRLPLTTAVRTAFDLARLDLVDGVVALDALLLFGSVGLEQLVRYFDGRRGWPGIPRARAALKLAAVGAESPMETKSRLVLVLAGLPVPALQHVVFDERGHAVARLDMAYPQWRIGIEYQGDHHRDRTNYRADVARLNHLQRLGWTIIQVTADDVLREPERFVATVRAAIRRA